MEAFLDVRDETERRAAPLTPEDQLIQSMPDASPAKWHRAHTTWFFEQFLLGEHCRGLPALPPGLRLLFNSYYVSAGPRHARHQRGHLTRPGADEITAYRRHVDAAVVKFFQTADDGSSGKTAAAGGSRSQSRTAASGIDADRHPARLRAKSDSARLRRRLALPRVARTAMTWVSAQRGHPHHRACRRQLSFRQREARPSRAGRPGQARPQPRHQRRVARVHERRRLRDADALADGRICGGEQRTTGRRRATGARSTANGRS